MPARTESGIILGKTELLKLAKLGQTVTPALLTAIGCLEKFTHKVSKETNEVSCRQFSGMVASGEPAKMTITAEGYRYIYLGTDSGTSVSYDELRDYCKRGVPITFQHSTYEGGDPIYTQKFIIKEVELTAENKGIEKWSLSLESSGDEVVTLMP